MIPPLRDRIEDVGALVAHLGGAAFAGMEPAAFRALCLHDWPRNVRELEDVVKRAVTLAGGKKIRLDDLSAGVRGGARDRAADPRHAQVPGGAQPRGAGTPAA